MANYKIEHINGGANIENPLITISSVIDDMVDKCTVEVVLSTATASFGINLEGFTYKNDTWENSDIESWVNTEIQKYIVQ